MCALKIIGGEARGRAIWTLPEGDLSVRPILGRIKKSLFDIIQPKVGGCRFLDLFAGTGAVGLEALSRGAKKVIFVELDQKPITLIKKNLEMFNWADRAEILNFDIAKGLDLIRVKSDIIFLGPPYKDFSKEPLALVGITLENIVKAGLMADDAWIIAQHHQKEPIDLPNGLREFRTEEYGDSVLSFYKRSS